jgi:hypothetical protein
MEERMPTAEIPESRREWSRLHYTVFYEKLCDIEAATRPLLAPKWNGAYEIRRGGLNLEWAQIGNPNKGGVEMNKAMLYTPTRFPDQCVLVANLADGWSSYSHVLCERHGFSCFRVRSTTRNAEDWINEFKVFSKGRPARLVYSMWDGKPKFWQQGNPMPFEDLSNYQKKRIKDRLTRNIIAGYSKACSGDIDSDDFWSTETEALIIEQIGW